VLAVRARKEPTRCLEIFGTSDFHSKDSIENSAAKDSSPQHNGSIPKALQAQM